MGLLVHHACTMPSPGLCKALDARTAISTRAPLHPGGVNESGDGVAAARRVTAAASWPWMAATDPPHTTAIGPRCTSHALARAASLSFFVEPSTGWALPPLLRPRACTYG